MGFKIVSGGQTGVDQAALKAAITLGIPHGGWCPKGRLSENGEIPKEFDLKETVSSDYSERTKKNIDDSDGTLIVIDGDLKSITDGTILTIQDLKRKNKPYFLINLSHEFSESKLGQWIKKNDISILNVAGPRESQSPGIHKKSFSFFSGIFHYLISEIDNTDSYQFDSPRL